MISRVGWLAFFSLSWLFYCPVSVSGDKYFVGVIRGIFFFIAGCLEEIVWFYCFFSEIRVVSN